MNPENRLKTAATLSSFWDGTPVTRLRAGDGGSAFHGRRLSVHLMAQPIAAGSLLTDPVANGQGLLARFLLAWPASTVGSRTRFNHSSESDDALDLFGKLIGAYLRREVDETPHGGVKPRHLRLSADARGALEDFAEGVETAQGRGGDLEGVRPFASKAAEHACRLAAVMTLFANPDAELVEEATMQDAIRLAGFYLGEARRLVGEAEVSAETAEAERMRRWLVEGWAEPFISVADATQFSPLRDSSKVQRSLARIEAAGWLVPVEAGAFVKGKRRRKAWRIVRPI